MEPAPEPEPHTEAEKELKPPSSPELLPSRRAHGPKGGRHQGDQTTWKVGILLLFVCLLELALDCRHIAATIWTTRSRRARDQLPRPPPGAVRRSRPIGILTCSQCGSQARWEREGGELSDALARSDLGLTEARHDSDENRAALAQSPHKLAAVREAATKEVRSELDTDRRELMLSRSKGPSSLSSACKGRAPRGTCRARARTWVCVVVRLSALLMCHVCVCRDVCCLLSGLRSICP